MDEAAAVPGPGDLVDPSQFFPEPEDRPRVGPEYQAVVPDAVDPEIAAAARAQSRIKSQIVAPSLVADGPAAGEALAALVEDSTAARRRLTRGGRGDARSGLCSPELLQAVLQACRCDLSLARLALRPAVDYAEAAGAAGGAESRRAAAWKAIMAAGAAARSQWLLESAQRQAQQAAALAVGSCGTDGVAAPAGGKSENPLQDQGSSATGAPPALAAALVLGPASAAAAAAHGAGATANETGAAPQAPPSDSGGGGLSEVVTTAFVVDAARAAAAFYWAAAQPNSGDPPQLPEADPEWRRLRSREPVWTAVEAERFASALLRHSKNFVAMAPDLSPRSPQQCTAFYYGDWRRAPGYVDARGRQDLKDARVDAALRRREHAWFHYWRFDEAALGAALPPAAVRVPPSVLATSAPPISALRGASGNAASLLTKPVDVLPALCFNDAFQLPYICPAVEVLVDDAGRPVDPPPPTEKKPPPGELPPVAATPAPPISAALQALAERQHVDPLRDYGRLLAAAAAALRTAKRLPLGANGGGATASELHRAEGGTPVAPAHAGHGVPLQQHTPHAFCDSWVDDRFIDNESFCALCGDGGDMICCDGVCRRSFHVHCVKSSESALRATVKASPALQQQAAAVPMLLKELQQPLPSGDGGAAAASTVAGAGAAPPSTGAAPPPASRGLFAGVFDFSRDDWRCSSCVTGEHECYVCGLAGLEGVSVFRCSRMCGKFYHLQCLVRNPLTRWLGPTPPDKLASLLRVPLSIPDSGAAQADATTAKQLGLLHGAISHALAATPLTRSSGGGGPLELLAEPAAAVRFVCPFHTCSGCKQAFSPFQPPLYYRCHACPTAFHVNCVPPDARWDMADVVTCGARASHDAKFVSKLYRKKSGLISPNALAPVPLDPLALLSRTRNLASGRKGIMGDALQRKLSTTAGAGGSSLSSPLSAAPASNSRSSASAGQRASGGAGENASAAPAAAGASAAANGLDAQRTFVSNYIGHYARTGVRTHIELLDREYYEEIQRRYKAVVASGARPSTSPLVGVKPTSRPGGGQRFISRVSLSQTCIHLGSFGTSFEAAVAFDYGTTYLRGTVVPSVNFPGSASDCRVEGPMDPWPKPIADAIAEGRMVLPAHKPIPGEEGRYEAGPGPQEAAVAADAGAAASHTSAAADPAEAVSLAASLPKRRRVAPASLVGGDFDMSGGARVEPPSPSAGGHAVAQGEWSDDDDGAANRGGGARARPPRRASAVRGTLGRAPSPSDEDDGDDDDDEDVKPSASHKRQRSSGASRASASNGPSVPFSVRYAREVAAGAARNKARSEFIGVSASNAICTRWCARATSQGSLRQIGTYDSQEAAALAFDAEVYRLRGSKSVTNFAIDPATGKPDPTRRIRLVLKAGPSSVVVNIRPGQTAEQAKEAYLGQINVEAEAAAAAPRESAAGKGGAAASAAAPPAKAAPAAQVRPGSAYPLPADFPRFYSAADLAAAYDPFPAAECQSHGVIGIYRPRAAAAGPPAAALIAAVFVASEEPARQILVVAQGPVPAGGGGAPASAASVGGWLRRAAAAVDSWNFALYGPLPEEQAPAPSDAEEAPAAEAAATLDTSQDAAAAAAAAPSSSEPASLPAGGEDSTAAAAAAGPPAHPHPGFNLPLLPPVPLRPADWRLAGLRAPPGAPHAPPLKASLVLRPHSAATRQLRESAAGAARHGGYSMIEHATRMRDSPELYGLAPLASVSVPSTVPGAEALHDRIAPCRHDACEFKNAGKDHFREWAAVVGPAAAAAATASRGSAHRFVGTRTHLWRHEMSLLPHGCDRTACALCIAVEAHDLDLTSAERRPRLFEPPSSKPVPAAGKRPASTRPSDAGGAAAAPGAAVAAAPAQQDAPDAEAEVAAAAAERDGDGAADGLWA